VQNPRTLVTSARPETREALRAEVEQLPALPREDDPVTTALNSIGTVHFARLVFLDEERLAVTTTYDGDFERYIMGLVDRLGPVFDQPLRHVVDPPPLLVQRHPDAFPDDMRRHDLGCVAVRRGRAARRAGTRRGRVFIGASLRDQFRVLDGRVGARRTLRVQARSHTGPIPRHRRRGG
jgi:hypothetical protein